MKRLLGPDISDPPGLVSDLHHRLIDVFMAASDNDMKEEVLKEFCKRCSQTQATKLCAQWARQMATTAPTMPRAVQAYNGTELDPKPPY